MGFNLYFDIAALIILVFLITSIALKKQFIGRSNRLYFSVIIVALVATILDILGSMPEFSIPSLIVLNTFFFLARGAMALSLFFYACNLGKIYYRLRSNRWGYVLLFLPYLILTVCLIVNFFDRIIFDYLPGPHYERGPLAWIAYAISYLYLGAALVIILYSRKYHSKSEITALCAAFLLQVGASIFQFFVKDTLVEMFVAAITLLTLSLFIESPENFIDYKTQHLGYRAFTVDIERQLDLKESFNVLLVYIINSSTVYNLYPHDQALAFNRVCAAKARAKAKKIDSSLLVYFLGNATFAYVFNGKDKGTEMKDFVISVFSEPMTHNGISFQFMAKTCLLRCPQDCDNVASLIGFTNTFLRIMEEKDLDIAPYRKEAGNALFELDHILERAIHEKSFTMNYQGIYSLEQNRFAACEGLLRLNDPTYGLIMPSLMIPYAEACGKIGDIGLIVLEKTFAFFSQKLRGKIEYIEVNLSPTQLLNLNLPIQVNAIARKYGIDSSEVVFEITEQAASREDPVFENNIKLLQREGFRFAIDDFGTGYSNLSRIMQLDISVVKFDRSMTDLLAEGKQDDFFLGLFPVFHSRGIKILFEGVETKEVVDKLQAMGVDYIQGYYFSKALPEEQLLALLDK